jgi:hypothetical protein
MKKLTASFALLAAPALLMAGTVVKAPVVEPCTVPFTGTVSVGYESTYLFRGLDYGSDAPWMGIDTNWVLLDNLSLDLGAWYINPTQPVGFPPNHANDELDLYATFNFPLWIFNASLGTVLYNYPEAANDGGADDTRNIDTNFGLSYSLPWFDVSWLTAYDWNWNYGDGSWYHEVAGSKSFDLTNCLSMGLSAGVGFYDNYNGGLGVRPLAPAGVGTHNGYSHTFVTLGLTWAMTQTAALDVYVGGNFVNDDLEVLGAQGDQFHGGASVSVSF